MNYIYYKFLFEFTNILFFITCTLSFPRITSTLNKFFYNSRFLVEISWIARATTLLSIHVAQTARFLPVTITNVFINPHSRGSSISPSNQRNLYSSRTSSHRVTSFRPTRYPIVRIFAKRDEYSSDIREEREASRD